MLVSGPSNVNEFKAASAQVGDYAARRREGSGYSRSAGKRLLLTSDQLWRETECGYAFEKGFAVRSITGGCCRNGMDPIDAARPKQGCVSSEGSQGRSHGLVRKLAIFRHALAKLGGDLFIKQLNRRSWRPAIND